LVQIISFSTRSKDVDFIIGTKTVLLHRVLIYTAPHRGYRC
jgi:hypothetical protein